MTETMIVLGRRVCGKRNERGLTQKELAQRVRCSPTTISNLEQGKLQTITIEHLKGIARALDISTDYLLAMEEVVSEDEVSVS